MRVITSLTVAEALAPGSTLFAQAGFADGPAPAPRTPHSTLVHILSEFTPLGDPPAWSSVPSFLE
jgi:hypothetical protein